MQKTWIQSLGQEYPLEKGMAIHSSILAWKIPWTEEPGGPQSIGSQSLMQLSDWACAHAGTHLWAHYSSIVNSALRQHLCPRSHHAMWSHRAMHNYLIKTTGLMGKNGVGGNAWKFCQWHFKTVAEFCTHYILKKYINIIINIALYLEKDLKFASGSECQKDCSLWVFAKWKNEDTLKLDRKF